MYLSEDDLSDVLSNLGMHGGPGDDINYVDMVARLRACTPNTGDKNAVAFYHSLGNVRQST